MAKLRGTGVPHYNFEQTEGTVVLVPNETIHVTSVVSLLILTYITITIRQINMLHMGWYGYGCLLFYWRTIYPLKICCILSEEKMNFLIEAKCGSIY